MLDAEQKQNKILTMKKEPSKYFLGKNKNIYFTKNRKSRKEILVQKWKEIARGKLIKNQDFCKNHQFPRIGNPSNSREKPDLLWEKARIPINQYYKWQQLAGDLKERRRSSQEQKVCSFTEEIVERERERK